MSESQPQKGDDETAYSPLYGINSKSCKNLDGEGGEGEDILRKCKGYGGYSERPSGAAFWINRKSKFCAASQRMNRRNFSPRTKTQQHEQE